MHLRTNTLFSEAPDVDERPHLILHFDLNGTIMAGDISNGKTVDDSISQMLCEDVNLKSKWSAEVKEAMTFRDYIEKHLLPGDAKDQVLKKQRQSWYRKFPDFLAEHKHEHAETVSNKITSLQKTLHASLLFPAFLKLIEYLNENHSRYTIVLRTFGNDLAEVIREIETKTALQLGYLGKFAECHLFPAKFNEDGVSLSKDSEQSLSRSREIYDLIRQFQFVAIQDDWKHWHKNGESAPYGKPFFYDAADANVKTIFFDDNFTKQIIKAVPLGNEEGIEQQTIQQQLLASGLIVDVDTISAVENESFFIDKVKQQLGLTAGVKPRQFAFS